MGVVPAPARKAIARTSNPSQVLIVGSGRRLSSDLTVAGHQVEVVDDLATAKRDRYAVVLVESSAQASAARERFRDSTVLVRTGSSRDDERAVEEHVRPMAVAARPAPNPVDSKPARIPRDAGPPRSAPMQLMTAKQAEPATLEPPRATTVGVRAELQEEIFFSRVGGKTIGRNTALDRTLAWLTTNATATIVVEGYADPSGTADANLVLSGERAAAVKAYLVGAGIDAARIDVKPLGDTMLKYGRSDGRNRRVAISAAR
ncbi:MAG TPA: OmpA family protein [Kofleriaceae bacterium]|jgi:OOP family OmpA-OmpF porin